MLGDVVGDDFDGFDDYDLNGFGVLGASLPPRRALRTLARLGSEARGLHRVRQPQVAQGLTPLPFDAAYLPAAAEVELKAWQQILLAGPFRLQLDFGGAPAEDFSVTGLRLGQNECMAALGPIPARAFVLEPGRMLEDLQLLEGPVLQPGSLVCIRVQNHSCCSQRVRAALWGRTVRDTSVSLPPLERQRVPRLIAPALHVVPDPFPLLPELRFGCRGPGVRIWQAALRAFGFDLGCFGPGRDGIDEVFGPATAAATRQLQQQDFDRCGDPEVVSELGCVNRWTRRALGRRAFLGLDFFARPFDSRPVSVGEPPAPPVLLPEPLEPAQLPPAPATPPEPEIVEVEPEGARCERCEGLLLDEPIGAGALPGCGGFCAECAELPIVAACIGDRQATAALLAARAMDPEPDHTWQTAAWEE